MKIPSFSLLASLALAATAVAAPPQNYTQALWVFPDHAHADPVADPTARQTLISNAAASKVDTLYISVYHTPNSAGRLMYEDTAIADLIARAHAKRITVVAAYGNSDWPSLGCDPGSFPQQRMQEVLAYNAANPSAAFDGVVLDVEPAGPQTSSSYQDLLRLYRCLHDTLAAGGIRLSATISAFWNDAVEYPSGSGQIKPVYQHIIDMDLQNVIVMGYRDFAGSTDCPTDDGIVCLDIDEVSYAASIGKTSLILAGLETSDPATTFIADRETFFEEGQKAMNSTAEAVAYAFGSNFGGFAVHNYQNSYLSGASTLWPTKNNGRGLPRK